MPDQIVRRFRQAMPRHIVGRGNDHPPRIEQLAGFQRGIAQRTDADGDIGPLVDQIDDGICQRDIQLHLRVQRQELRHQRQQADLAETHGGTDAQPPAGRRSAPPC